MEASFWHNKWQNNDIAFHEGVPNNLLVKYFETLRLTKGTRVFVPLCGKTRDIAWLLEQGYEVCGAELHEAAIKELFNELHIEPYVEEQGSLLCYRGPRINIFVGDIFELTPDKLGKVDGVYDRAALVALPSDLRKKYCQHLISMTHAATQLIITFNYDQKLVAGPPFSISKDMLQDYYSSHYSLHKLEELTVPGGLKGVTPAAENAWLLTPTP